MLLSTTLNMKVMEINIKIDQYLDEIRPYLNNLIDSHRIQGERKTQSTMAIKFFYSTNSEKVVAMHNKSDNIEILIGNETD